MGNQGGAGYETGENGKRSCQQPDLLSEENVFKNSSEGITRYFLTQGNMTNVRFLFCLFVLFLLILLVLFHLALASVECHLFNAPFLFPSVPLFHPSQYSLPSKSSWSPLLLPPVPPFPLHPHVYSLLTFDTACAVALPVGSRASHIQEKAQEISCLAHQNRKQQICVC